MNFLIGQDWKAGIVRPAILDFFLYKRKNKYLFYKIYNCRLTERKALELVFENTL